MVNFLKIQDEINRLLVQKYPSFTVYINKAPQKFERPSFLIEFVKSIQSDANKDLIKEVNYFTITYFSEVNENFFTDKLDLQSVLVEIMKIFRIGYITVEDRAIKVKASDGGSNDDEIYLDLQFEYFEDRTDEVEEFEYINEIIIKQGGIS